jgi:hypothetical protein
MLPPARWNSLSFDKTTKSTAVGFVLKAFYLA